MKKIIYLLLAALWVSSCKKDDRAPSSTTSNVTDTQPRATATTITFSGYTWTVKNSGTGTAGPGPNYWADANAYVDANGYLHLKLTKSGSNWYCAEVTSTQSFGYGTYQWWVEGAIDQLDKNVVLGLFNYSGVDGRDEMDIEYAKWGVATANNTNFTVYPAQTVTSSAYWHSTYATTLSGTYTTQRFKRTSATSVFFQELGGFQDDNTNLITSATCSNPPNSISTLSMPIHMNLWLYQGTAPSNATAVEVIIHAFKFTAQ